MEAWYISSPNQLEKKILPALNNPEKDEVLIKVQTVCICNGSDPGIVNGSAGYPFPMIFGHEAYGKIIKAGSNVNGFKAGDRVSWWCTIGVFAEYLIVKPEKTAMFHVPGNVTDNEAPVLELVIASSRSLMKYSNGANGKKIAILGLGPSGLVGVQLAKLLGFSYVCGWDLYGNRRSLALELGADEVFDPSSPSFLTEIENMPLIDVGLDMMGDECLPNLNTFDCLIKKMNNGGELVSYGHPGNGRLFRPDLFQSKNIAMISPENNLSVIRQKGQTIMEYVENGGIKISPLITHVFSFDEVKNIFEKMLASPSEYLKVIFILP